MWAPVSQLAGVRPGRGILIGALIGIVLAALGIATGASPVSAHTSFVGSTPTNGSTVAEPVSEILIEFTNPSTEAGDGFVVLDPAGQIREPSTVTTDDGRVFRLGFEPALAGGEVGVRWSVRAGDAHPIEGSFAFTVGDAATARVTDDTSTMPAEGDGAHGRVPAGRPVDTG